MTALFFDSLDDPHWLDGLERAAVAHVARMFPETPPRQPVEDLLSDAYLLASLERDPSPEHVRVSLGALGRELTRVAIRKYLHGTGDGRAARFGADEAALERRRGLVHRWWQAHPAERQRMSTLHRVSVGPWNRAAGDQDPVSAMLTMAELEPPAVEQALQEHFGRSIEDNVEPDGDQSDPEPGAPVRRARWVARARRHVESWATVSYRDLCPLEAQPFDASIRDLPGGGISRVAQRALAENAFAFQRGPQSAADLLAVIAGRWQTFGYPFYPRFELDRTALEYLVETCALVPGHLRIAKLMGEVLTFACLFPLKAETVRSYIEDTVTVYDFTADPSRWLQPRRPASLFVMNYISLADQDLRYTAVSLESLAHLIGDAIVEFLHPDACVEGVPPLMATGIHPNGKHVLVESGFLPNPESRRSLFTRELGAEDWALIERARVRW